MEGDVNLICQTDEHHFQFVSGRNPANSVKAEQYSMVYPIDLNILRCKEPDETKQKGCYALSWKHLCANSDFI